MGYNRGMKVGEQMANAVYQAMQHYFNKIQSPSYFAVTERERSRFDPALYAQVMRGNYLIPRGDTPDFDAFAKKYGFPLPEALRAYYSVFHPSVVGDHPNNPHCRETLGLVSVLRRDLDTLFRDMDFWAEYDPQRQYVPIGCVSYSGCCLLFQRETGRIFVEFPFAEDPADDEDGKLWPEPLSNSLADFIAELVPYPTHTDS